MAIQFKTNRPAKPQKAGPAPVRAVNCEPAPVSHHVNHQPEPDVVVNKPALVVNTSAPVVVNSDRKARSADRHKDKAARRAYMKAYMAKRRALKAEPSSTIQ